MPDFELPTTKQLALELRGSILHVTFNRPEVRNAMSFAMIEELIAVFDALEDTHEVRIVVLRGVCRDCATASPVPPTNEETLHA